jgi:hypothetical protein
VDHGPANVVRVGEHVPDGVVGELRLVVVDDDLAAFAAALAGRLLGIGGGSCCIGPRGRVFVVVVVVQVQPGSVGPKRSSSVVGEPQGGIVEGVGSKRGFSSCLLPLPLVFRVVVVAKGNVAKVVVLFVGVGTRTGPGRVGEAALVDVEKRGGAAGL